MKFLRLILIINSMLISIPVMVNAEENLAEMYQRKGVKSFVARQYDQAISDLEQARVIDPSNQKVVKLISKCYERKGASSLDSGNIDNARECFTTALEFDATNEDAVKALARLNTKKNIPDQTSTDVKQTIQAAQQPGPVVSQQTPLIITPQVIGPDTQQAKVVASLLTNFQTQQQMMAQQLQASNDLLKRTDQQKDEYMKALVQASDQKSDLMNRFIIVGAVVVVVVIVVALVIFVFLFSKFSRASDLRTIQATEALQAVLANQPLAITKKEPEQLLLDGPLKDVSGAEKTTSRTMLKSAVEALTGVTLEELTAQDPSQRARAIELLESELNDRGSAGPDLDKKVQKLKTLLDDTNNRVRANAAKAYYLVDTKLSMNVFKEMLSGGSSRLRASALWALGEIGTQETLSLIMENENETDEIVKYNIKMALDKIKSRKRISLSNDETIRLEKLISKYSDII
jgi:tetratricopeptide (TPR) repeat protein